MRYMLLTVAFLLEMFAFFFFAALPFATDLALFVKIIMSIGLFIGLIVFWGKFMAPKAGRKFINTKYHVAKLAIYSIAAISIFMSISHTYCVLFVATYLIDEVFIYLRPDNLRN